MLRTLVRRIPRLRETLYLASELRSLLAYDAAQAAAENARDYESRIDLWNYSSPWGTEHLATFHKLLGRSTGNKRFHTVLDVGCGEGWVSASLATRCDSLLGVDVVGVALARARERCSCWPHLRFVEWDLQKSSLPGRFDLVLLMGVLECFSTRREFRVAREKAVTMVEPGAFLLVTTARQSDAFDSAWWGRWLPRGDVMIREFIAKDPRLLVAEDAVTSTHRFTLYRRRA